MDSFEEMITQLETQKLMLRLIHYKINIDYDLK
jgi:hypothetical protein